MLLVLVACRQTRYVPEGRYLLKKNKIVVSGDKLDMDEVASIIRQNPNFSTLGIKAKLMVFNMVDSSAVAEKRKEKNDQLRRKNRRLSEKEDKINNRRILRAREKNKSLYTQKIIQLKDTVTPRMFFREWLKYKIGQPPVIFDSLLYEKTVEQLALYLRKKGYYYGTASGNVEFNSRRKAIVEYNLETGNAYRIDSVYIISSNSYLTQEYRKFLSKQEKEPLVGEVFDMDRLDEYRSKVARFMRDNAVYGFSPSHLTYVADTNKTRMTLSLGLEFSDRLVRSSIYKDSMVRVKHRQTFVKDVFFHIADTTFFKGNFKNTVEKMGLTVTQNQFLRTLDTLLYDQVIDKETGKLDIKRKATFLYNGKMEIDAGLLELQNYLEKENYYKEYYLERSYTRLLQLGLFQAIKPEIIEIPGTKYVEAHYYLVPAKRQTFGFEPRFTTSNGFLGVQSSVNYTHKNLFGGGQKLTFEIGGGFESQPPVFEETLDGEKQQTSGRSFNTFEVGPSLKLDVPGLFPTKVTMLSKRQRPRTIMSLAYNYQNREDFERHIFQTNYLWRFYVGKTQIFQAGLPFASIIKFVSIDKQPEFEERLNLLNDLFLKNAYSDQFIWQDWKLTFEYNNKDRDNKKGKSLFYMTSTFDPAGNTLSLFKRYQDTVTNGQHAIFGVGYSQFLRLDNDVIYTYPIKKKQSIHLRFLGGFGVPYGNTVTSLPYDYSFFGGGANDNRGWKARQLGPGGYKYYLDTNRTATQIGDIRIAGSAEYRFSMGQMIKGALFFDAGNIWTLNEDVNRPGSQFSSDWFKQIALSGGAGIRLDLDFFIVRLDIGLPITNPALPSGGKWIFQSRESYYKEGIPLYGQEAIDLYLSKNPNVITPPDIEDSWIFIKEYNLMLRPFMPQFHIGIGYPF